ncbi:ubiquinone biosynthesis protein COQ9 [Monaibacterium marinum]|uniref:Ubiquinone biosynthesis protein COQ9 n=1 Tax=Pontivivens marinum TaxID=1690039 RepID=A0A2C9CSH0_9RHOB|nr:COQ9 family protein [Monaibacterium marinum]SOH93319.1 ubiquinone biosynthesis protein COQ9 [Monaibacterium marinum]
MTDTVDDWHDIARNAVLDAALIHVAFDGWSQETLLRAIDDSGVEAALAHALFPRGGVDLALAFHYRGDRKLSEWLPTVEGGMTAKITQAVWHRLELVAMEKEAVRRGATLFALPTHVSEGASAIWNTADTIWNGLGDSSTDYNWYTKRATLSAVYSATMLYWLGDTSADHEDTREFLDRRIANVMQIEKAKARLRGGPLARMFAQGPGRVLDHIRAPVSRPMPGRTGQ